MSIAVNSRKIIRAADLFCGAGGTSTGLVRALRKRGYEVELTAINHWDIAVATHRRNHPEARVLHTSVDAVNPLDLFKPGELDLLVASPECIFHSRARGGRPINDQRRASAFCVCRWAEALMPGMILVENVEEFADWGPLGVNGKPLKSRKGETFRAWKGVLESLGYKVDVRVLRAADFGDPTTRERLFVQAVRGRRKINWPEPSHFSPRKGGDLFGALPWVPVRECIDWTLPSKSIYERKRPLAEKTLRRIEIGLRKFGLKPFIVQPGHGNNSPGADNNRATSGAISLVEPFIIPQFSTGAPRSVNEPLGTITTTSRGIGFAEPFLVKYYGTGGVQSANEPLDTVTTKARFGLVRPEVIIDGERYVLDIRFRMLKPRELARAQGFPDDYDFAGNQEQIVCQIGNAVPGNLAEALIAALVPQASTSTKAAA